MHNITYKALQFTHVDHISTEDARMPVSLHMKTLHKQTSFHLCYANLCDGQTSV